MHVFWSHVHYNLEETIITPRSLATGTGLISLPSNLTTGKNGRPLVISGTPITRSLVLSGLMTREFVQHRLAIASTQLSTTRVSLNRGRAGFETGWVTLYWLPDEKRR